MSRGKRDILADLRVSGHLGEWYLELCRQMDLFELGIDPHSDDWSDQAFRQFQARHDGGDARALWSAAGFASRHSLQLPHWAVQAFAAMGGMIRAAVVDRGRHPSEAERVGRSLGFGGSGRGSASRQRHAILARTPLSTAISVIALEHKWRRERGYAKRIAAVAAVQVRDGISRTKIWAALREFGDEAERATDQFHREWEFWDDLVSPDRDSVAPPP